MRRVWRGLLKRLSGLAKSRDPRHRLGAQGEAAALQFLLVLGSKEVARNVVTPFGEIDLIVDDGDCRVIVEVKVLADAGGLPAKLKVDKGKQKRLRQSALFYLKSIKWKGSARIDVMGKNGAEPFEHIKGAVPLVVSR